MPSIARSDISDTDDRKPWMIVRLEFKVDIDEPLVQGSEEFQALCEVLHELILEECKGQRELRGRKDA